MHQVKAFSLSSPPSYKLKTAQMHGFKLKMAQMHVFKLIMPQKHGFKLKTAQINVLS